MIHDTQCGTFIRLSCLSSVIDHQIMVSLLEHYLCKKYDLPKQKEIFEILLDITVFLKICVSYFVLILFTNFACLMN